MTAADAVAALATAVRVHVTRGELTAADLLACARAGASAAQHAVTVAGAINTSGEQPQYWAATPDAWRGLHRACAPFDDGTKTRSAATLDVLAWAAYTERASRDAQRRANPRDLAEQATAARAVVNQLPGLAESIETAIWHWSRHNHLLARERRLPSYEDRNMDATLATDRVVFARDRDLDDLAMAARDARTLSADLAAELHRSSGTVGQQAYPALAAAHAAATRSADTSVLRIHAARAQARMAATARSTQWGFAPRSDRPSTVARSRLQPPGEATLLAPSPAAQLDPHAALLGDVADRMLDTEPSNAYPGVRADLAADVDDWSAPSGPDSDPE